MRKNTCALENKKKKIHICMHARLLLFRVYAVRQEAQSYIGLIGIDITYV